MSSNNNDIDNVSFANETRFLQGPVYLYYHGSTKRKVDYVFRWQKTRVGVCCHGNKVFTAKSHTMHYYCPKRHMYQMSNREALTASPCCHGNEVSAATIHTMDQYCAKETVNQKEIDRLSENKVIEECPFCHGKQGFLSNGSQH